MGNRERQRYPSHWTASSVFDFEKDQSPSHFSKPNGETISLTSSKAPPRMTGSVSLGGTMGYDGGTMGVPGGHDAHQLRDIHVQHVVHLGYQLVLNKGSYQ